MKTKLVRIGNSRGVRIPKAILEQCRLGDEVELDVEQGRVVIKPLAHPRAGWDQAFRDMATRGDDQLLDQATQTTTLWDETEWEW